MGTSKRLMVSSITENCDAISVITKVLVRGSSVNLPYWLNTALIAGTMPEVLELADVDDVELDVELVPEPEVEPELELDVPPLLSMVIVLLSFDEGTVAYFNW